MKAIVTYDAVQVTDNGSVIYDSETRIYPMGETLEKLYKRRKEIEENTDWRVTNIKITFTNDNN